MKKLIPLLACAVGLVLAAGTSAGAPTSVTEHVHVVTNPYVICSNFVVVGDFAVMRTTATFYNNDGNPIRRVLHIHVDGTVSNSVTGALLDFLCAALS
jgi:hypothetical protein